MLRRTDTGSRLIKASAADVFRAWTEPDSIIRWLPPAGMTGECHSFDLREGGSFHMTWHYQGPDHGVKGKTSEHADSFEGRFVEIQPNERLVEEIRFRSDDPAFAEPMRLTVQLTPEAEGTQVSLRFDNVPETIREEDHRAGIASSLQNLADFLEMT